MWSNYLDVARWALFDKLPLLVHKPHRVSVGPAGGPLTGPSPPRLGPPCQTMGPCPTKKVARHLSSTTAASFSEPTATKCGL